MRAFKFRAWNKKENEMVDLVTVGSREVDKNRSTWPALYYRKSDGIITGFDHEDYEVLQYTGLKDKNGVEIYEGDVLSAFYGTQLTEVKWNAKYGLYEVALQLSGGSETGDELLGNHLEVVEVIGNIYENPELLSGEQHGSTS